MDALAIAKLCGAIEAVARMPEGDAALKALGAGAVMRRLVGGSVREPKLAARPLPL